MESNISVLLELLAKVNSANVTFKIIFVRGYQINIPCRASYSARRHCKPDPLSTYYSTRSWYILLRYHAYLMYYIHSTSYSYAQFVYYCQLNLEIVAQFLNVYYSLVLCSTKSIVRYPIQICFELEYPICVIISGKLQIFQ